MNFFIKAKVMLSSDAFINLRKQTEVNKLQYLNDNHFQQEEVLILKYISRGHFYYGIFFSLKDEDVFNERMRINNQDNSEIQTQAVVMRDLTKVCSIIQLLQDLYIQQIQPGRYRKPFLISTQRFKQTFQIKLGIQA